jgi:hypothetical protein
MMHILVLVLFGWNWHNSFLQCVVVLNPCNLID